MAVSASVIEQTLKKRVTPKIRLLTIVLALVLAFSSGFALFALGPGWLYPRDTSVRKLHERPSVYVGQKVNAVGYLVKHTAPHFGDEYNLCEGDPRNLYFAENPCVAVSGEPSIIDPFLSFVYNGTNYEVGPCPFPLPCRVTVSGVFRDRGSVTDASQYVIESSSLTWLTD